MGGCQRVGVEGIKSTFSRLGKGLVSLFQLFSFFFFSFSFSSFRSCVHIYPEKIREVQAPPPSTPLAAVALSLYSRATTLGHQERPGQTAQAG